MKHSYTYCSCKLALYISNQGMRNWFFDVHKRLNKKFWKYKFSSEKRTTANEENCQMAMWLVSSRFSFLFLLFIHKWLNSQSNCAIDYKNNWNQQPKEGGFFRLCTVFLPFYASAVLSLPGVQPSGHTCTFLKFTTDTPFRNIQGYDS